MPQRQEPIQEYFPSARLRLIVRLEDFGADDTPAPPDRPVTVRKGKRDRGPVLDVAERGGRLVLVAPGEDPDAVGSPQEQIASRDRRTFALDGIIPRTAQVMRNGIRTADTMSADVPFADLPIDPRVIRSCAVELFIGTVTPEDFQRGMDGQLRSDSSGIMLPRNVVPEAWVDRHGRQRTNLRFQGWVDEMEDAWSQGDSPSVHLECTDNTRLLIEQDAGPKLTVAVDVGLDRAFADYLANYPQFRGLSVEYRPGGEAAPVLKAALSKTKYRPKLGPAAGGKDVKVWDYLTDVAGSVGHVVFVDGTTVVIQRVRTLYDARGFGRPDDPFVIGGGRELPDGRVLPNRLYVYGRDISDMSFRRKFTAVAPQNVEVRSYDSARKRTLVARFPLREGRQKRVSPGDASDQVWKVKFVEGVKDEPTLRVIAQGVYEALTRNEIETSFSTKNLGSFGGGNLDPDMLDCHAGDAIDVEVLRGALEDDDGESSVEAVHRMIANRGSEFLRALGYSEDFADAYQQALDHVGLQTTFRVRSLGIAWDAESEGVTLDVDAVNYVEVRADQDLEASEQIVSDDPAAAAPTPVVIEDGFD